jgi:prefoldin subunit 5
MFSLLRFLFGTLDIEEKIQILETQVSSLQQKLINLEAKLTFEENSKYALSRTLEAPDTMKSRLYPSE